MKPGTPGFVGGRLREAREARGLSAAALAELLDISRQAVSQYESGQITPGPEAMRQTASHLRLPVAFFLTPPAEMDLGTIFYRSMAAQVKQARLRAERRYQWVQSIVRYTREFVDLPPIDVPDLGFPTDPARIGVDDSERAAEEMRRNWRMGAGPISNVIWLLENHGIVVVRDELGAVELDAFSSWVEGTPCMVLGNDKESAVRSRFDAAHELGHLVMHRRIDPARLDRRTDFRLIEDQAHRFAGAFLLPGPSFAEDVNVGTLDEFVMLKAKWRVAVAAMIHRAADLALISPQHAQRLWRSRGRRGWNRQEPFDDEWPLEQPRLLRRSFELMLGEGGLSRDEVLSWLPYDPKDIEDLTSLPRGHLSEGPVPISLNMTRHLEKRPAVDGPGEIVPFVRNSDRR